MKTETCLTQPKYLLIAILIQLSAPPPILITVHVDYVQSYQVTFLLCILFLNFWRSHAILTLSFEGVCGKKPYKVTLDLQSNSPFVGGSKKQFVRRILLSVRCYFTSLFHATLHYFVHATGQEDNNVFGSTLKRLLLYWGKVSVVNPDCFGFACMYESLHLVSINGLTATHLQ